MSAAAQTLAHACAPWCHEHRDFGDIAYCQSTDRDVAGQAIFIVGAEVLEDIEGLNDAPPNPAGIYFFSATAGMPGSPLTLEQAKTERDRLMADATDQLAIVQALSTAISDLETTS